LARKAGFRFFASRSGARIGTSRAVTASVANPGGAAPVTHARMLALAIPVTLSNLSTPLLGIVNAAAVGRLGDTVLLGAVALGAVIFDILFWSFGFLRMGTAGLTAQAYGARDEGELRAAFLRAMLISLVIGGAILLLRAPFADAAIAFMKPSAEVARATRDYFDARVWAAPVALANYAVLGSLVGRGRTDLGLAVQIAINAVNIVLSLLFVSVWNFGVVGVAWASVVAEVVGLVLGLFVQYRAGLFAGARWPVVLDRARMWRTLAVNRDIFLRTLALIAAIAFFTRQGSQAGDAVLAANAVLHNLFLLGSFFLDGFATATEQTAGQAVGARDRDGFSRATRLGAVWCMGFGAVASALFLMFGGALVDLISTSPDVRATARIYLVFAALTPIAGALAFLFDGVFIGATWTRAMRDAMVLAFVGAAAIYVATRPWGNAGLWTTFLMFLLLRGLVQAAFYAPLERRTFATAKSG
jgi:MATE family multidrug resistance protein